MAKTLDEAGVKRLIQEIKGANKNLNAPIPISTENTTESKAQNVKNIADYVEKAKAAGIANVNGMAVTCLIDDDYSGVGYLYGDTSICGIKTNDALEAPSFFDVDPSGSYHENEVLVKGLSDQITSDMLVEGARRPIILTPSTTEVDEETYQKLLSDDVDVVFKTNEGYYVPLQRRDVGVENVDFYFSFIMFDGSAFSAPDTTINSAYLSIKKTAPHVVNQTADGTDFDKFLRDSGFIAKGILSPVLQEIDLTGTDADRKAKLDQFEADWKALTGADDLTGARFVGKFGITDDVERNVTGIMTYCAGDTASEKNDNCFYGICNGYSFSRQKSQIAVKVSCKNGSLTITPLFSHLEAITIKTGNTPEDKAANVAAIKAYVDNLKALGVDVTKGYMIPVKLNNGYHGFIMGTGADGNHTGIIKRNTYNYGGGWIFIDNIGTYQYLECLTSGSYDNLTTTAKTIVPAINEVNALAGEKADKSLNAKSLEAITIGDNTPEGKAATKAVIEAYRDNLTALGVDVTKGFMIPIKTNNGNGFILFDGTKGDGYIKVNNDCYGISITANYAVAVNNLMSTLTNYQALNTTSKRVLPAINEVNALAKGYSTIFTPIELTTETAQNKTAIDARVAAFTAQGISLTNGCCIPVTYKGVYAGNISLINGDWYGLLVKNTNNPADNINIKLSADGTITEGNSAQ